MADKETRTPVFLPIPSAMLVAVPPNVQAELAASLAPLALLRVGHIAAACERMLVTWPLVLVVGGTHTEAELATLRTTAIDISAEVVLLSDHSHTRARDLAIVAAVKRASLLR